MKLGFAVQADEGMESKVYGHFGSAPAFLIVDTEREEVRTVNNQDLHHVHGACNPVMALDGNRVDGVVVGGIGAGAIMRLNQQGIRVYQAVAGTVRANLDLMKEKKLPELSIEHACRGHEGKCGH